MRAWLHLGGIVAAALCFPGALSGAATGQEAVVSQAPLPNDVERRPVTIWSDGTRMAGDLYSPKNRRPETKLPAIVLCAGTGGTKGGTQARLAPLFARSGYVVLAFDYRGWGESESQLLAVGPQPKPDANNEMTVKVKALRWQMSYTDQTEDIRAAISFVAGEPAVDKDRIALWGSSYGGGLVTTMAALDPRVKCVAAQVPGMTHYGIYREGFAEAVRLELEWFPRHLKAGSGP